METVTILKSEYDELVDNQMMLNALQCAGVDNWEWYDDALEAYREWKRDEECSDP